MVPTCGRVEKKKNPKKQVVRKKTVSRLFLAPDREKGRALGGGGDNCCRARKPEKGERVTKKQKTWETTRKKLTEEVSYDWRTAVSFG